MTATRKGLAELSAVAGEGACARRHRGAKANSGKFNETKKAG